MAGHDTEADPLLVIAHPRTGSNSLVALLECHPQITLLNEPFSEGFTSWNPRNPDFRARRQAGDTIGEILDDILSGHRGLKEHTYHLDDDDLAALVGYPAMRVVALTRANLLEQAVSQVLAEQTGLWKTWDAPGRLATHYDNLEPLDPEVVADRMQWAAHEVARLRAVLDDVPSDRVLHLGFESVFRSRRTDQAALLAELWTFLGVAQHEDKNVWHYLSSEVQQARPDTYGRVPNLVEIEEALGNDATGHLGLVTEA